MRLASRVPCSALGCCTSHGWILERQICEFWSKFSNPARSSRFRTLQQIRYAQKRSTVSAQHAATVHANPHDLNNSDPRKMIPGQCNLQAQQRRQSQRRQLDAKLIKRTDTARGRKTDQTDRHHTCNEINQRQIEGHAGQCNLQAQQRGQARRRQLDAHPGCLSQTTATKIRKRRCDCLTSGP